MKSWTLVTGLGGIVLLSALTYAEMSSFVTASSLATGGLSGDRLASTDDISPIGDHSFSISPDGKWLLYPSAHGNILAPAYVLYNIEKRQRSAIGLSPKVHALAAQGRGPLGRAGCWAPDNTRVFLPGDRILFVADARTEPLQWDVMESVTPQEFRRYYDCPGATSDAAPLARIVTRSPREVDIVSAAKPDRVFASHKASRLDVTRIGIRFLAASSNRQRLSYVVSEFGGSFFIASRGYVVDLTSPSFVKPRPLADHVLGPILWSSDNAFAYACIAEDRGSKSIYRWRVTDDH